MENYHQTELHQFAKNVAKCLKLNASNDPPFNSPMYAEYNIHILRVTKPEYTLGTSFKILFIAKNEPLILLLHQFQAT